MVNKVAVVGCGWFGLALAKSLVADNIAVCGSKRDADQALQLAQYGIEPIQLDLEKALTCQAIAQVSSADAIVVNIPPKLRQPQTLAFQAEAYLNQLQTLIEQIDFSSFKRIIFISSTAVYADAGRMTEQDAVNDSPKQQALLQAEQLFLAYPQTVVLRFAGLIGPKRHPGRFFAGKQNISGANAVVNLVHQADCIGAVKLLLTQPMVSQVYNLVAAQHPTKETFYRAACLHMGQVVPQFNEIQIADKQVDGSLITKELGFVYQFDDPLTMLDAC